MRPFENKWLWKQKKSIKNIHLRIDNFQTFCFLRISKGLNKLIKCSSLKCIYLNNYISFICINQSVHHFYCSYIR